MTGLPPRIIRLVLSMSIVLAWLPGCTLLLGPRLCEPGEACSPGVICGDLGLCLPADGTSVGDGDGDPGTGDGDGDGDGDVPPIVVATVAVRAGEGPNDVAFALPAGATLGGFVAPLAGVSFVDVTEDAGVVTVSFTSTPEFTGQLSVVVSVPGAADPAPREVVFRVFPADWAFLDRESRWRIDLDFSSLAVPVADFPVPVDLTPLVDLARMDIEGDDVAMASGLTPLHWQWESAFGWWTWVRFPVVQAPGVSVWVYTRGLGVTEDPPPVPHDEVFPPETEAVWHLTDEYEADDRLPPATINNTHSIFGVIGGAAEFEGHPLSRLTVYNIGLLPGADRFAVTAFVQPDDSGDTFQPFFGLTLGIGDNDPRLAVGFNDNFAFRLVAAPDGSGSSAVQGNVNDAVTLNDWQHVAFIGDLVDETVRFYVDGALVEERSGNFSASSFLSSEVAGLTIGTAASFSPGQIDSYQGGLDELRVFRGELIDDAWVAAEAATGNPQLQNGPGAVEDAP